MSRKLKTLLTLSDGTTWDAIPCEGNLSPKITNTSDPALLMSNAQWSEYVSLYVRVNTEGARPNSRRMRDVGRSAFYRNNR